VFHPKLRPVPIAARHPERYESLDVGNSTYDPRKVAIIIEKRYLPTLVPVLHTFLTLVPPEWPFELWTSQETGQLVASSQQIRPYIDSRKLHINLLPDDGNPIARLARPQRASRNLGGWKIDISWVTQCKMGHRCGKQMQLHPSLLSDHPTASCTVVLHWYSAE
jgi:hypothetical protein